MKKLLAVLVSALLLASCGGGAKKDPIKPDNVVPTTPEELEAMTDGENVVVEPIVDEATKKVVSDIEKIAEEAE